MNLADYKEAAEKGVPLHVLLSLLPKETREDVAHATRMSGFMAAAGMDVVRPHQTVLAAVAVYMGWLALPDGKAKPKKRVVRS